MCRTQRRPSTIRLVTDAPETRTEPLDDWQPTFREVMGERQKRWWQRVNWPIIGGLLLGVAMWLAIGSLVWHAWGGQ